MKKQVSLHIYQSPMTHESRILKETSCIAQLNRELSCVLVGTWMPGLCVDEALSEQLKVVRIQTYTQRFGGKIRKLWLIEWLLRLALSYSLFSRAAFVHAHSLLSLPLTAILKPFYRYQLVYDCHELETETSERTGPFQVLIRLMERFFISSADLIVVVSPSILEFYKSRYPHLALKMCLVRNIPARGSLVTHERQKLRESLGIQDSLPIFLYQGVLGEGRGIEFLFNVWADLKAKYHLVFLGFGPLEGLILEWSKSHKNIHFHQAVSPEELSSYTFGADVGLCLTEHSSLNNYYCLPNKLFQYVLSGVPAIVSDFPDMKKFVEETGSGWALPRDAKIVRDLIDNLDAERLSLKRNQCAHLATHLNWEIEVEPVLSFYRRSFSVATNCSSTGLQKAG
jgi:glycosyltransferase involved in cell wall biosynthesis